MGKRWMLFREMECGDSHRPQRFRSLAACYRFPLKSPQPFLFQHPSSHWELQSYLGGGNANWPSMVRLLLPPLKELLDLAD